MMKATKIHNKLFTSPSIQTLNINPMDKAKALLQMELDKNQTESPSAQPLVFALSVGYLSAFFAIGGWCGLSLFSPLSLHGRIIFTLTLLLGLSAIFLILKQFPRHTAIRLLVSSLGVVSFGWMVFFTLKNYGVF